MANVKISNLTAASTPVAGTEVLPIVQSGATVKVSIANLTPGLSTITTAKGGTGLTSFTANGVVYASSTSALTTGSALVFDGTNLGVGVTPSAWSASYKAIQLGGGTSIWSGSSGNQPSFYSNNLYFNGTNRIYLQNGYATEYVQSTSGTHSWYTAASGTAGNAITFTQAMTLDASGRLGIGQTSSVAPLSFADSAGTAGTANKISFYQTGGDAIYGLGVSSGQLDYVTGGAHVFYSRSGGSSTERARIDSSGNLLVGTTSVINSCKVSIAASNSLGLKGTSATGSGDISFNRADNGAQAWRIASDGTNWYLADADFSNFAYVAQNFTAWSFGSDRRIKTDIEDIQYGLNAVMAMKPRQYKMLVSGVSSIGFIAQELQTVIPEAVQGEEIEYLDTDTPQQKATKTMGVSKETLIPVLVKAIQEQQALITQMQADVAALKGA